MYAKRRAVRYFVRGGVPARSTAAAAALASVFFFFRFPAAGGAPPRGGVAARSTRGGVAMRALASLLPPAPPPLRGGVVVSCARRSGRGGEPFDFTAGRLLGGVPPPLFGGPAVLFSLLRPRADSPRPGGGRRGDGPAGSALIARSISLSADSFLSSASSHRASTSCTSKPKWLTSV